MRAIDKIRNYINSGRESGALCPGARLPSYHNLMEMFGGSYATIRSAMAKLEKEGLVDILNGTGTFVAGARKFNIDIYCLPTTLEFERFSELLEKYIAANDLHINIRLKNVFNLIRHEETVKPSEECKAILIECPPGMNYNITGLYSFWGYDGYEQVIDSLIAFPNHDMSVALPFYSFSGQLGVNCNLLRKTGFPAERITGDFKWWEEFVAACGKVGVIPATSDWPRDAKWPFGKLCNLFFALKINELDSVESLYALKKPYFNTTAGRRMLEIMRNCTLCDVGKGESFCEGNSVMDFLVGSWIATQNKHRPNVNIDELKVIPYRFGDKKIFSMVTNSVQTHLHSSITAEEKNRVWEFLKILLSKDFQKEFCGLTGALSVRNDMRPEDYAWFCDDFAPFMPEAGDIVIYENIFNRSMKAYLTGLFEQFKLFGADIDVILQCMDAKI